MTYTISEYGGTASESISKFEKYYQTLTSYKMRKTVLFFILLLPLSMVAGDFNKRVIFLWDVTYSMHGGYFGSKGDQQVVIAGQTHTITKYLKKYDIYDAAMDMLISYIDSYQDTNVELVVVPFGSQVLGTWRVPATVEGKTELISKIRNFCELSPEKVQATHIAYALEHVQQRIITAECDNMLYLMTDGLESKKTEDRFIEILKNWCAFSEERKVDGYYFALTDQAVNKKLKDLLSMSCMELVVGPPTSPAMCQVEVQDEVVLSVVDDKGKNVALGYTIISNSLDKNAKVRLYVEDNPYVALDCIVELSNTATSVILKPQFKEAVNDILVEHPEIVKVFCERDGSDSSNLILSNSSFNMILKNRKIKKMVITVAD